MDHEMRHVSVGDFLSALRGAVDVIDVVQPESLRDPLSFWFRSTVEKATWERWASLLGRSVVPVWNAANAVVHEAEEQGGKS